VKLQKTAIILRYIWSSLLAVLLLVLGANVSIKKFIAEYASVSS